MPNVSKKYNDNLLGWLLFIYLAITILLFEFGPWPWPVKNKLVLYLFLLAVQLSFLLGFLFSAKNYKDKALCSFDYRRILYISIFINLVLVLPTSYYRTGVLIPNFSGIFSNLGEVYFATQEIRSGNSKTIEYIRIILSPLLFAYLPIALFYWREIKKSVKIMVVFTVVINLFISINMGISKAFVDLVIIFFVTTVAKRKHYNSNRVSKKLITNISIVLIFMLFLSYFGQAQQGRLSDDYRFYDHRAHISADTDNILLKITPSALDFAVIQLTSYTTQGYYGLSLSMQEQFDWTYGLGHSTFLYKNIDSILNNFSTIEEKVYPYKTIKYGWDPYIRWSSFYSWVASDVTFFGVPLLIFIIAYLLGLAWRDTITGGNVFSVLSLAYLCIMVFYWPANNQIFQTGESFVGFSVIIVCWLLTRKWKIKIK